MYNVKRVKPASYKEYEVHKQDSRRTSVTSETQDIKFICPLHGEVTASISRLCHVSMPNDILQLFSWVQPE